MKISALQKMASLQKPKDKDKILEALRGESESTLQGLCEGYLTLLGLWHLRIPDQVYALCGPRSSVDIRTKNAISENLAGVPDLLIFKKQCIGGNNDCMLVELKSAKGRLSPRQKKWRQQTVVHVIKLFEAFKILIDEWVKK